MIFFTSDLHFGHESLVLAKERSFLSVDEMDECMIERWNKKASPCDDVIVLGDMFRRNKIAPERYLERLNGRLFLIRGNHDNEWLGTMPTELQKKHFWSIRDSASAYLDRVRLFLSHYPMISWDGSRQRSILVCGHIHGITPQAEANIFKQVPFALNAGVDANEFQPVTFTEMVLNNQAYYGKFSQQDLDHLLYCGELIDQLGNIPENTF